MVGGADGTFAGVSDLGFVEGHNGKCDILDIARGCNSNIL